MNGASFLDQSDDLNQMISDWIGHPDSLFLWKEYSPGKEGAENAYLHYYIALQARVNSKQYLAEAQARWKFIKSWTASEIYESSQLISGGHMAWRNVCDAYTWMSRTRAIEKNSIDAHLGVGELLKMPVFKRPGGPSEKTLREYVDSQVKRGAYVKFDRRTNKKEKCVTMSVSEIWRHYASATGAFAVRCAFRDGRYGTDPVNQKKFFIDCLGMTTEIWDYAMAKDWQTL